MHQENITVSCLCVRRTTSACKACCSCCLAVVCRHRYRDVGQARCHWPCPWSCPWSCPWPCPYRWIWLQGATNQVEHMPSLTGLLFFLNGSARALVLLFLLCACACMSACVGCSNGMQDASIRTCIPNDKTLVELALQPLMMIQNTTVHVTGASWICEFYASCTPASHGTNLAVIM